MEHTKKPYQRPRLVECGGMQELTLGSTGPQNDLIIIGGVLAPDNSAPGCTTNGPPACLNYSH